MRACLEDRGEAYGWYSGDIGTFAAETTFDKLPREVVLEAKRRLLDVIGIGLSASTTQKGKDITSLFRRKKVRKKFDLGQFSQNQRTLFCFCKWYHDIHLELDDVHRTSHTHPGVSVIQQRSPSAKNTSYPAKISLSRLPWDMIFSPGLAGGESIDLH
jgi:hypothetical protein